ncbi:MAG TPA: cytochrome P460 family protein, partial [Burkholderiales bacterium]|nr:cytochrome P460 family protein [Burkholderiales bacterium]
MRFPKLMLAGGLAFAIAAAGAADRVAPAPNGIEMPADYKDWRVIGISDRSDNHTMRAILGNDVAIAAARGGRTNPWPDGTRFAKVAWKEAKHPNWPTATVPGDFVQVEFMIKDAKKYA